MKKKINFTERNIPLPDKGRINIGFIGCGNIAHFHADVLKDMGMNIVAVSARENSPNLEPFAEKYGIENQYTKWESMVEKEALDALWVVASWHQMDSILIPLIKTRMPLFLEKPVALSSEKINQAIDIHTQTKQYIQVGYNRRFYPFIEKIKTQIEKGDLRSVLVEIPESVKLNNDKLAWYLWLVNSSHVIDLLYYFVGQLSIKYNNQKPPLGNALTSSFNAMLETKHGTPVHLSAEWNTSNNFGITFFVDNKRIVLKPLETAFIYEGFDVVEPSKINPVRQYMPKLIEEYKCDGKYKPGFYEQADYFFNTYNSKISTSIHADLNQCFNVTELIEEIIHT